MKRKKEETNENYEIGNKIKYYLKEKKEKMRDQIVQFRHSIKGSYAYFKSKQFKQFSIK